MDMSAATDEITEEEINLKETINKLDFSDLKDSKNVTTQNTKLAEALLLPAKALPPSKYATNLERFRYLCKDLPSPDIFIEFNFYFMVASCLNRKIWFGGGNDFFTLYPNLYIICVSPPGIGKSIVAGSVNKILDSLEETKVDKAGKPHVLKLLNMGPDAITFEKLVQRAADANDGIKLPSGKIYSHASTCFCLGEELGMLFTDNTKRVVSFLMQAYDCNKFESDNIKNGEQIIRNICVNFLGCTNPQIMKDLISTRVLDNGFTGRAIFLYDDKKRPHTPWIKIADDQMIEVQHIKNHLRKLCKMLPREIQMSEKAKAWFEDWHYNKADIHINEHPKLLDYYARKKTQLVKLAVCHAFSDKHIDENEENKQVMVKVGDFLAADRLLTMAEQKMHKAISLGGTNPLADISDKVVEYLKGANGGPIKKSKLYIKFYEYGDTDQMDKIFAYLTQVGICKNENIAGKDGIRLL